MLVVPGGDKVNCKSNIAAQPRNPNTRRKTFWTKLAPALCMCAAASPVAARADLPPANATEQFRLQIFGQISPRCSLNQSTRRLSLGDVLDRNTGGTRETSGRLEFEIDCNSAFAWRLRSGAGALAIVDGPTTSSDAFRTEIEYRATLDLTRAGGGRRACDSREMSFERGGRLACSGVERRHRVYQGEGVIEVEIARSTQPVLRGAYRDRVSLTVSPYLGG